MKEGRMCHFKAELNHIGHNFGFARFLAALSPSNDEIININIFFVMNIFFKQTREMQM
jgi:hypothetical protein